MIERAFYLLFFLVPLLFLPFTSELFEFNKMMLTYGLTTLIVAAWAAKSILAGRLIFRRTPLDFPLLILFSVHLLSTFQSIDLHTSIWGYYSRANGGLLSTVSYMLLYWAFVSNMDRQKTRSSILYLLSSATLVAVWGALEHFGLSPSCLILRGELNASCWIQDVQNRVFATLGQPNWMAAWLVALMPISWAFALRNHKSQAPNPKLLLWIALSALLFTALLFTKSRSGLLGFAAASAVFWGFSRQVRPALILNTLYIILILLFGTPWTPSVWEVASQRVTSDESPVTATSLETDITPSGEIRKIVWKGAIDAWKARPLLGHGVETFAYIYYQFRPIEHNLTSEWDFLYNKAHNEYLNFLATTGVLGLGSYLFLIVAALWFFLKSRFSILNSAFLAGYVSILITNFFGFSVVPVTLEFFIFPAFAFTLSHNPQPATHHSQTTIHNSLLTFAVLLITSYLLLKIGAFWYADVLYARAQDQVEKGEVGAAIKNLETAIRLHEDPNYYNELSRATGQAAASLQDPELAEAAVKVSNQAVSISGRNISILKSRAVLLAQLATVDEKYLGQAISTLETAASFAPTEPKIHYNLGVLYDRAGQRERAIEILEKTLELKPDYEDAKEALEELK